MFITLGRSGRTWLLFLAGLATVLGLARLTLPWERPPLDGMDAGPGRPVAAPAGGERAAVTRGPEEGRQVALTFDVLEGERVVLQVLDTLAWRRTPATFFVTGLWAQGHPDLVRQMVAAGHEVALREPLRPGAALEGGPPGPGPGRRSGRPGAGGADPGLQEEAARLARLAGQPVRYVRPAQVGLLEPAGAPGPAGGPAGRAPQGVRPVLWSLDLQDWMNPGTDYIAYRAGQARPGDILLLQASDFARQTPRALPRVLDQLAQRGLRPVTLSTLLGKAGPAAP
ncbi:polysaccharide deacetylase family protein [Thermaerobacter subterraneus]|uniref:Xylanase/chitin deacetylase n=1 Tax=Thermaerobacter subterraneus DSM 13965 TaxID=867903 RepID=K6QBZ8_9FIRM|nr:polysaccharide deacetylase family protein [Thermaerobacter subterraneus]EKP93951.1 putative xylanase/chitin deacetylase [Thermaerobacter subterraneus DSM 13965]